MSSVHGMVAPERMPRHKNDGIGFISDCQRCPHLRGHHTDRQPCHRLSPTTRNRRPHDVWRRPLQAIVGLIGAN